MQMFCVLSGLVNQIGNDYLCLILSVESLSQLEYCFFLLLLSNLQDAGGQRGKELAQGQGLAEAGSNPSLAPTSPLHCPRAEASSPYRAARQAGDRRLQLCSLG